LEELRRMAGEYPAFGGFTVAENGANLGFGAACNRGAAKGSAPLLFFLNLDTEVWPDVFLRLDEAAVRAPQETAAFECRQLPYETGHHIDPVTLETSWASGAALAVRRAAFTSVGGFDEHLFMYCEDVDFSWRLRAGGYRLQYVPAARVTHYSYENGGPKLGEYAGSFYGNLLLRYKFGSWRDIWRGHKMYLGALRRPLHFNGVRRVLAKNYLRHFIKLWPFLFWRFSHRAEYGARPARFEGGFSPDRGLWKFTPPQETPLISVIVRTCGRPQTLKRTLESLRWQTYRNFEIIVAEDGPPAAREMVERDFAELPIRYLNDGRFHGRAANGNRGLAAARGALCNFLDDDDFFYPDHLELLAGVLCAHPEADLVLGSAMAMFVAKDGTVTEVRPMVFDRIDRFTMCQNCRIPIQTVLFRRSLFERYGGLIETLEAHEDWGMWLKYLEHGRRITPHAPDVRRATSLFVQPAAQSDAAARMEAYRKSDADFYSDASLCFNVTLADMRRYYDDMIADMRCLEARGELHEFLEQQAKRGE
jgi:GT2 family glycosyltransferase